MTLKKSPLPNTQHLLTRWGNYSESIKSILDLTAKIVILLAATFAALTRGADAYYTRKIQAVDAKVTELTTQLKDHQETNEEFTKSIEKYARSIDGRLFKIEGFLSK